MPRRIASQLLIIIIEIAEEIRQIICALVVSGIGNTYFCSKVSPSKVSPSVIYGQHRQHIDITAVDAEWYY